MDGGTDLRSAPESSSAMTQPSDQATTSILVAMYQRVPAWPHGGGALAMDNPRSHMAYLHHALAADEDVPGLDVPMDDVALIILRHRSGAAA